MLADKVFLLPSFKRQYESILILSVSETISELKGTKLRNDLLATIDWNNILGIGSILSFSDNIDHLEAALRIAQTCVVLPEMKEVQKAAAAVLLENLTNKQAIKLAIERNYIKSDYLTSLPFSLMLNILQSNIENSLLINNRVLSINKFQKAVHLKHINNQTISISAPTSAGKSFILYQIIIDELSKQKLNIVYLVPTRALISQVEQDIRMHIKENELSNVTISTVPQIPEEIDSSNVFIFTQERLHWFLLDKTPKIDLLIIDEAQKIDDGNRGILLQQKIEEVVQVNPDVKVFFSSPFTLNPQLLLDNINNNSKKDIVNTQFVAVNQNLLYLSQIPKKVKEWEVLLCSKETTLNLGRIVLKDRPGTSEYKKLAFIAQSFSNERPGNLIYSNGAAESEKIGLILYDLLDKEIVPDTINELIKLVKKTIHKEYTLAKILEKRIAFHYGNMPLLIRQEIERLFKEGEIKYLICTSTLLEGVNLPAKSIFIRRPTRGRNTPLNENDFWNLAGRAGRLGKEFNGNIVCIEPSKWEIPPNPNKSKQLIRRAIDIIEDEKAEELLDFIRSGSPRELANSRQDLEFAFGYYYIKFLKNEFIPLIDLHNKLLEIFTEIKTTITLPDYIIKRNPGISPLAQQSLLNYFYSKQELPEELIPVYPEDINALDEYTKLIGRIGKTLSFYHAALNVSRSILVTNWMRGRPLAFLISSSYQSYQSNDKYKKIKSLPVVIREVMDNVENFVRFKFAKDSSCYVDILRYFLEINNRNGLLEQIPELSLWLEFGVSQKTHLSLLSLGLSRNTVIELSNYITNTQMNVPESKVWLQSQNLDQIELSPIMVEDIKKVL
jgi:superfamily II DNA/RNA helicase